MARQTINVGAIANDGTGDTLRTAGQKINTNFSELYSIFGDSASLTSAVSLSDNGFVFNLGSFTTTLKADSGASNLTITFPDSSGTVSLLDRVETLLNKTLVNPIIKSVDIDRISFSDFDSSHKYTIIPNDLTSNATLRIPALVGDSDELVTTGSILTLTNKTLTDPKINSIVDANDRQIVNFTSAGTAVNELTITSAATGSNPSINATGDDTNISINLVSKGTGATLLDKLAFTDRKFINASDSDTTQHSYIVTSFAGSTTIHLRDGTRNGEYKLILNAGSGAITLDPPNGFNGTNQNVQVSTYGTVECIWSADVSPSNWILIGQYDSSNPLARIV
jgi:hypothetical protein